MSARPVLIMAGGTGGHVYPALAVARWLREAGVPVVWMGTRVGLEARVVPEAGFEVEWLEVSGLRGKGPGAWILAPLRLGRALAQAWRVLGRRRPRSVLGMGGFVAGPGGVAAWLRRVPLVVHEQNAVAGLTNRLLEPLARRLLEGFPGVFGVARAEHTGNPVRAEIAALPPPEQRFAGRDGRWRLLVVGGSLGAQVLNETLPAALAQLDAADRPEVLHQAGARTLELAREAYMRAGVAADVRPFLEDMAAAYGWADLAVCRAGALTIAELAAAGLGAILIPYPHAVDDHQSANARYLTEAGAAELIPQAELSAGDLARRLAAYARDPALRLRRAVAARGRARPEAAASVARAVLEVAV